MKFDGNLAWKQATAWVSANRDVLIALAGVFFLLPSLAFGLLLPQPAVQSGMAADQVMAVARGYYLSVLPFILPMLLFQAVGTLAMLTLFTDRRRPTVGESIRRGLVGVLPYILAQILLGAGTAVLALAAVSLAAVTGVMALLFVAGALVMAAAIYVAVRTSLVAPVVAVEGVRNPISALTRSWKLTGGNSGRLLLFYLLVGIAFAIVVTIVTLLVGILIALVASGEPAQVAGEVIRSILGAVMSVYIVATLAAVHRQLVGPSAETEAAWFE